MIADLTVKYNSQIKISKIIEANDDYAYGVTSKKKLSIVPEEGSKSVSSIMKECLTVLQDMTKAKDQEIEQYLEEFAEEKVSEQMNMKTKYNRMIAMQKAKQDCTDEKIKALEDKKK